MISTALYCHFKKFTKYFFCIYVIRYLIKSFIDDNFATVSVADPSWIMDPVFYCKFDTCPIPIWSRNFWPAGSDTLCFMPNYIIYSDFFFISYYGRIRFFSPAKPVSGVNFRILITLQCKSMNKRAVTSQHTEQTSQNTKYCLFDRVASWISGLTAKPRVQYRQIQAFTASLLIIMA